MKVTLKILHTKINYLPYWLILTILLLQACEDPSTDLEAQTIHGKTMGTHYTVKILLPKNSTQIKTLSTEITSTLNSVNNALSNWQSDSEISEFNTSTSIKWQTISQHFYNVMHEASIINKQSSGHFDVTLSPLIDLWGFGPSDYKTHPTSSLINTALKNVNQSTLLTLKPDPLSIKKIQSGVTINLSAIAKGYGIDQIALMLNDHGINNYLIDIGGDLKTHGVNISGQPWRIAIEKPNDFGQSVQAIISLNNMAIATSGDYRNFFIKDGMRMSHIIDPVNGYPITHNLASVTVVAEAAMRADGLATALLVLGREEGIKLANELNIAAYFITRNNENFIISSSKLFKTQYSNL